MKCPKCKSEMKKVGDTIVFDECVIAFFRCEQDWVSFKYSYSNPILVDEHEDKPRLIPMYGDNRYAYFKCRYSENCENYTLVAKRGHLATKEIIESIGLEVLSESDSEGLPAYRLYEVV